MLISGIFINTFFIRGFISFVQNISVIIETTIIRKDIPIVMANNFINIQSPHFHFHFHFFKLGAP